MKKVIGISSMVLSTLLLSACSDNLPKCDEKETQKTLTELINKALRGEPTKFINAKNFKEKGFNKEKEIRVCTTEIVLSNGEEEEVTYNVYWQNKKKDMYMVEIIAE